MANEKKEKEIRPDIDIREDFDPATGVVRNPKVAAAYDAEREKLLGQPVGSPQGYADKPVADAVAKVERAKATEKVVLTGGETPEFLVAKYSRKQLTQYAKESNVEHNERDSAKRLAGLIVKAYRTDTEEKAETSLTVPPAAPEINQDRIESSEDPTTAKG
jgi:hypothetical protein